MAGKKPIVKIRVYRGVELNYDANGNAKNENYIISMEYGSKIWELFKRNLKLNGYCKAELDSVWNEESEGIYDEVKDVTSYKKEVEDAFDSKVKVELTADQKRIAELEAKLEAFMSSNKEVDIKRDTVINITKEDVFTGEESIDAIRKEYEKVLGEKPHHMAKAETLLAKIAEHKE